MSADPATQHPAIRAMINLAWGIVGAAGVGLGASLLVTRESDAMIVVLLSLTALLLGIRYGRAIAQWVGAAWRAWL